MGAGTWFSTVLTRFRGGVIQDVPPGLEACECCRELDCAQDRWVNCAKRLAGEAERLSEHGFTLGASGRSDEMPGLSSQEFPVSESDDEDQDEDADASGSVSSR